jgi:ribonuclease HI
VERFISDLQVIAQPVNVVQARDVRGPAWIPPPQGLAKVNVDAATSKSSTTSAIAAVVRGEDGSFLGAYTIILVGITDPETLEAMAYREGLAIAADLLLQSFRLATDCKNVVRSVAGEGKGSYGHIVQEIKARTRSFQEVELVHERRT